MKKESSENDHGPLGICLIKKCGRRGTEDNPLKRGLCSLHLQQFGKMRKQKKIGDGEASALAWEARAIVYGMILPSRKGNKSKEPNVFEEFDKELAAKLASKNATSAPITTDPALDKQLIAASEKDLAKRKPADKKEVIPEKKPVSIKKSSQK